MKYEEGLGRRMEFGFEVMCEGCGWEGEGQLVCALSGCEVWLAIVVFPCRSVCRE